MNRPNKDNTAPKLISIWRWIDKNSAVFVLILAFTTLLSAFAGVSIATDLDENSKRTVVTFSNWFTGKIYESAQAMFLNMEPHRSDFNLCIGVARISAVLLVAFVAARAISKLFRDSFVNVRLWFTAERSLFSTLRVGQRNILIGGLGRIGTQLVSDLLRSGKKVVVVEVASSNYWIGKAEEEGAIVVECDVTNIDSLREYIFRDPEAIHLVTGNDLANINALANIKQLRKEYFEHSRHRLGRCQCFVHIDDPGLHKTLQRCLVEANSDTDPTLAIQPFNLYHETACQLIIDSLVSTRPTTTSQVALYVIFGFGKMGMAMLKELVEFAHFENQKRARILVLVPPHAGSNAAERAYQECIARWSALTPRFVHTDLTEVTFAPQCDEWSDQSARLEAKASKSLAQGEVEYAANVHFCPMRSAYSISIDEALALAALAGAQGNTPQGESTVKAAALFCFEEDETNFRLANELNDLWQDFEGINVDFPNRVVPPENQANTTRHNQFSIPIFAYLPGSSPLRDILSQAQSNAVIKPFGAVQEGLRRAHDPTVESVAIRIAWSYASEAVREVARVNGCKDHMVDRSQVPTKDIPIPADDELGIIPYEKYTPTWLSKRFWDQTSNRNAAEHARVMMQILGFEVASGQDEIGSSTIDFDAFDESDKRRLAAIEHNRWVAERLLMGWMCGPKMTQPPLRPSLCSNEFLTAEEWIKDYNQIVTVFNSLNDENIKFRRVRRTR